MIGSLVDLDGPYERPPHLRLVRPADPPLATRLRRALDDAETDVQDMGHVWLAGDQIVGDAALRLIARDRALLDDLTQAEAAMSAAVTGYAGDKRNGTLIAAAARCKEARQHAERAAAFWADPT